MEPWYEAPWNDGTGYDGYLSHGSASSDRKETREQPGYFKDKKTGLLLPEGARRGQKIGFRAE